MLYWAVLGGGTTAIKSESTVVKTILTAAILTALLCSVPVLADQPPTPAAPENEFETLTEGQGLYNAATPFRLFDPSRLSIRHSYQMSYYSSSVGSGNMGLFTSSIGYQLARSLYLQLDLGIMHQPSALLGGNSLSEGARILPNFSLRYTPSPKFHLIVDVRTMPGNYYGYGYGPGFWSR
jgi:hypothetical protein